ncbi:NAD-dependent protein deacylase [Caulobacter segnis]|uniref:NAD-dependent protein deacylase n=1 Tax=Caulobacter segnis TaxID=88688 RepID=A0ABM6TBY3_9CAUL|nr:NAD-dependent deacylase [Caulobacter segnis]AVQ00584.1 NAD-dependent protein deacylase [Caulobacter segnis]
MRIFVLTGAGVSAESGLGTFRDKDGVWTKYDLRDVATPEGFARDPARVRAFYNARRANLGEASPNAAHHALARLEVELEARGGELFLCTQNVDDLHEKAGSGRVVHMHGELAVTRCDHCQALKPDMTPLTGEAICEGCGRADGARPHVVWFGETPLFLEEIDEALSRADLFVSIGTSGSVYPAAGFVAEARAMGVATCEINLEPSANAYMFDEKLYGPASEVVPGWVERVLTQG